MEPSLLERSPRLDVYGGCPSPRLDVSGMARPRETGGLEFIHFCTPALCPGARGSARRQREAGRRRHGCARAQGGRQGADRRAGRARAGEGHVAERQGLLLMASLTGPPRPSLPGPPRHSSWVDL
eukprot:9313827-Pyramimonas_sp.AAC.1